MYSSEERICRVCWDSEPLTVWQSQQVPVELVLLLGSQTSPVLIETMSRLARISVRSQLVWLERHLPRPVITGLSAKKRLLGQRWTMMEQVYYVHRLEQRIAPQPQ